MNIDRLSIRTRPSGTPVIKQTWNKLLFMHWRMPAAVLRPHIPPPLEIDQFGGGAWISMTPFVLSGLRASIGPPIPFLSTFHELNVRTYVHLNGIPGVWFFSLDASRTLAVWGARILYHLPYHVADAESKQTGKSIEYTLQRTKWSSDAHFHAVWTIGEPTGLASPDTLAFFLVERYCLYAASGQNLYRARIFHPPWPLQKGKIESWNSTMIESSRLPSPAGDPLLHYSEELEVDIWGLEKV